MAEESTERLGLPLADPDGPQITGVRRLNAAIRGIEQEFGSHDARLKAKANKSALEAAREAVLAVIEVQEITVFGFKRVEGHLHLTRTRESCKASDYACFALLPGTVTAEINSAGHLILKNEGQPNAN